MTRRNTRSSRARPPRPSQRRTASSAAAPSPKSTRRSSRRASPRLTGKSRTSDARALELRTLGKALHIEVFFKTTDRDVRAVIIGGRPVYGAREFLKKFSLELQPLPRIEGAAVRNKVVHLPAHLEVNVERDFGALEKLLKDSPLKLKRNNLLVSADTPYRARINSLRQYVVSYGWQVQRWRRKKQKAPASNPVVAPAPPV